MFGFGAAYKLILVLRSQFFENLRGILCKHDLEHLEAVRLEKLVYVFVFLR